MVMEAEKNLHYYSSNPLACDKFYLKSFLQYRKKYFRFGFDVEANTHLFLLLIFINNGSLTKSILSTGSLDPSTKYTLTNTALYVILFS